MPGREILPVLGHAHSSEQHRHRILAVVGRVDLADRHGIIHQKVQQPIAIVVPRSVKRQHHAVVLQEASPGIVHRRSYNRSRQYLALILALQRVRIRRQALALTDVDTLTCQELPGERIAVDDAINYAVNACEKRT